MTQAPNIFLSARTQLNRLALGQVSATELLDGFVAEAIVVERVDVNDGRVKIGGEIWSAKTYHPDEVHEPGTRLNVMKIDGATALVG
jgi:membrane protein implicated in regulation of membrane protease activity